MISKKEFRKLLGPKVKEMSDKQINAIRDDFYSLGYALLEWHKKSVRGGLEENFNERG